MITPYTEFLERRERRQRVAAAFAQPGAGMPAGPATGAVAAGAASDDAIAIERVAVAAERPLPNQHTDANGFRTHERAT